MSYEIITDRLEVRSSLDKNKPRYVVNGYALVPNKYDSYGYETDSKGNVNKVLKSMFTPHCIESIKKQAKYKKLFVDSKHELFHNTNIKSVIKGKVSPDEEKLIDSFLNAKMLPIAKLNDINVDDKGLFIETELNPLFREVDDNHRNYFDAIWYSLENKYLNGISINFIPTDVTQDELGNDIINDLDISGFSYVDRPSLPEHNIVDVAIRSAREFLEVRSGEKMEEEKERLNIEKAKLEEEKKKIEVEKLEIQKQKEEAKKTEIEKQMAEQKRVQDELSAKSEALKKAEEEKQKLQEELNRAKGVIPPQDKFGAGGKPAYDTEFYSDNLKKITSKHDESVAAFKQGKHPMIDNTMSGFAELVNLQSKISPTAGMDKVDADYAKENRLLDRSDADIIAKPR